MVTCKKCQVCLYAPHAVITHRLAQGQSHNRRLLLDGCFRQLPCGRATGLVACEGESPGMVLLWL